MSEHRHITGTNVAPVPQVRPMEAAASIGSEVLVKAMAIAKKFEPCSVCKASPRPIAIDTPGGKRTVFEKCHHMLERYAAEAALQERCAGRDAIIKRLGHFAPPRKYATHTLASIKTHLPDAQGVPVELTGMRLAMPVARDFMANFADYHARGFGLFFYGASGKGDGDGMGQGTGKTMLSAAIANEVHALGYYVAWFKLKSLCERLFDYGHDSKRLTVLEAVERADLLVLDELIDEKDTASRIREFMRIVDLRDAHGRPTIITSNFDVAFISAQFEGILARDERAQFGETGPPPPPGDAEEEHGMPHGAAMKVTRFMSRFQPPHAKRVRFAGPDVRLLERADFGPAGE